MANQKINLQEILEDKIFHAVIFRSEISYRSSEPRNDDETVAISYVERGVTKAEPDVRNCSRKDYCTKDQDKLARRS